MWIIQRRPKVNSYGCLPHSGNIMWDVEEVGHLLRSGSLQCCKNNASKAFSSKCAASELASFVDLLYYLGHGSVNRHVFDLDGVCHVGEMISAPADVLKGAAGKVNHGAKAKARPANTHTHKDTMCKHGSGDVCLFCILTHQRQNRQIQRQTHTLTHERTHSHTHSKRLFLQTPPLVLTHLFCLNSSLFLFFNCFKCSYTCRRTDSAQHKLSHTYITGGVTCHQSRWKCDPQRVCPWKKWGSCSAPCPVWFKDRSLCERAWMDKSSSWPGGSQYNSSSKIPFVS